MGDLLNTMASSVSGMSAQAARLRLASENIANADTPGYRRKMVPFEQIVDGACGVRAGDVHLDTTNLERVYEPSHPMAGEDGYYESSNVNLMIEIADAREAQRSYEANLRMFDQARQMTSSLLELLRR
ncbi:MAG: flagellar basal body rod protein FlgC [Alphaproteobacteria bacterium]